MKTCSFQKNLLSSLLGELSQAHMDEVRRHLHDCPDCAKEYKSFSALNGLLAERRRPQVPPQIYQSYVNNLQRRFAPQPAWKTVLSTTVETVRKLFASPLPLYRLTRALAILAIGVLIGRSFIIAEKPVEPQLAVQVSNEDVAFLTAFLSRSEVLLLTIVNTPVDSMRKDDAKLNRELARALLVQTQQAQRKAQLVDDEALPALMTRLELVLLEVSNRDDDEFRTTLGDLSDLIREARLVQASRQVQSRLQRSFEMGV